MVTYCPRCEQHVNLNDVYCTENESKYYQCELCSMILCWEKPCCNIFDEDYMEDQAT